MGEIEDYQIKKILIDTNPEIDTSAYSIKGLKHHDITYQVAYFNEVTDEAGIYIFEGDKLISKIEG